ncbi:hypothetical protein D3C71_1038390 [compost metagenome]
MLTFVLMQAFNLDIKNRVWIDFNPGTHFHERRQAHFVLLLNSLIFLTELRIVSLLFQVDQLVEIVGPLFLQGFIQQRGKRRVALFDPATRRDAVGDVMELVRPKLVIFREQIFDHQIRVQRRHTVHRKAADHTHIRHADLFIVHHRQFRPHRFVARPGFAHQHFELVVDLINDLHMARQKRFHQLLVPALQRFWHQGVVGVSEGLASDRPGRIPAQLVLIEQYAQQFRDRDRWVSVVQLDNFVIRQLRQLTARQMMATQDIRHRTGALEILLHQAQFFTRQMVVVRVQNFGQLLGVDTLLFGTQEIAVVKFGQIERMRVFRLPQTQRLRDAVTIAQHRQIPGFAGDDKTRFPMALLRDFAANADVHVELRVMAEPRIAAAMPVVRGFNLMPVIKGLTEQAVLIVQTITDSGLPYRRH